MYAITLENNNSVLRKTLGKLEVLHKEFSETNNECNDGGKAFVDFVKRYIAENDTEVIYTLSDYAVYQSESLVKNDIEKAVKDAKTLIKKKKQLRKDIGKLHLNKDNKHFDYSKFDGDIEKYSVGKGILEYFTKVCEVEPQVRVQDSFPYKKIEWYEDVMAIMENHMDDVIAKMIQEDS